MYSYAGKIVRVNLSTGETATEPLTETIVKQYIGGVSLGLRLLVDNSIAGVDAFDPQNPLVFVTGPLTGTLGPAAGNGYVVVSKSPTTGTAVTAVGHSFLGAELKRAGYDALIITGKAPKLSALWIDDDKTQIINAEKLQNAAASKTQKALREELGDFYIRVSCIGEAGEKLCRFASIVDDELCVFGRGGLGAVMGSKNLKAIAVRGTQDVYVADMAGFVEFVKQINQRTKGLTLKPAAEDVAKLDSMQALATRNWATGSFEGTEKISGAAFTERFVKKAVGCAVCGLHCDVVAQVSEGSFKGATARVGFESQSSLGALCGVDQPDALIEATRLTNEYGLDPVSTGAAIAFAMDLYEQGIISKKYAENLELKFGNSHALIEMVRKIAKREGWLANALAEGVAKAAEIIGKDSSKYACHIGGLEPWGYDLRRLKTAALGFAVFSGENCTATLDVEGKTNSLRITQETGNAVAEQTRLCNVAGSLIVCQYGLSVFPDGLKDLAKYYTLTTGNPTTAEALLEVGERAAVLDRLFSIREGKTSAPVLPWKLAKRAVADGAAKGSVVGAEEWQLGITGYYAAQGWTPQGIPTAQTLQRLGLTSSDLKLLEAAN